MYTTPDDHKQDDPLYLSDSSLDKNEAVNVIKTGSTWVALLGSVRVGVRQKDLSDTDIAQMNDAKDKTGISRSFDVVEWGVDLGLAVSPNVGCIHLGKDSISFKTSNNMIAPPFQSVRSGDISVSVRLGMILS